MDLTTELQAAGTDVVLASIALIQPLTIFPNDNRLLRRVAFAETRDGVDMDTFRPGYNGGIWQVDEDIFNQTQDTTANPELVHIIRATADVVWYRLADGNMGRSA